MEWYYGGGMLADRAAALAGDGGDPLENTALALPCDWKIAHPTIPQ
jgi:hypothetical protein